MAGINWTAVAAGVAGIANIVKEFAPAAAIAGPEGAIIGGLIGQAAGLVSTVATQAEAAGPVLASNDLATIQAANVSIQAVNDGLATKIAES
jgi:hypothetical protein